MLLGQHGQNDQPRLFLSVHQISAYKLNGCLMISMRSAWALLPATCIDCPPWSSSSENERLRLCCWSAGKLWGNYSDSTSDRVSGIFRLTNDTRARTRRPADPPTSFLLSYSHCHHRRHRIVLQAPVSSQRCLQFQIVGVVILRCPVFVAVGRLRTVPTIIPVGLDPKFSPASPTTRPADRLVVAATPASSSIKRYCADCTPSASPRPPDHSS